MSKSRPDLDPNRGPSQGFEFAPDPYASNRTQAQAQQLRLGVNEKYANNILEASERSGLSPGAVAAIISAEAATVKGGHGLWDPKAGSHNPNSTVLGLGQFTRDAWIEMANTRGSALYEQCKENGWLGKTGQLNPAYLRETLDLRTDPRLSIITTAEYDVKGLHQLQQKGVVPRQLDDTQAARYAYLAHHEGVGGAAEILTGRLHRDTARLLYAGNFPGMGKNKDGFEYHAAFERSGESGRLAISVGWENLYPDRIKRYTEERIQPSKFLEPVLAQTLTAPEPAR